MSLIGVITFPFFGYAFYFGGWLRWSGKKNNDVPYDSGVIFTIIITVLVAVVRLGNAFTHMSAIKEAQVAGRLAKDTMGAQITVDPKKAGQ